LGADHNRGGRPKATRRIAGVVSQQLRHLEVLLHAKFAKDILYIHDTLEVFVRGLKISIMNGEPS
jgi:hypothetical protein